MQATLDFTRQREHLVDDELRKLGIRDEAVLDAMRSVPREEFVAENLREFAYRNAPLGIGLGQTISQPFIVARMAEALELKPGERVLEVGAGSGYAAAVVSRLVKDVYAIERHGELAEAAAGRLKRLGYHNVQVRHGDGTLGWPEDAPFDAIVVAASGPRVPAALLEQLKVGGRLVIPIGADIHSPNLVRTIRRENNRFDHQQLGAVRFVPLIGEAGWSEES